MHPRDPLASRHRRPSRHDRHHRSMRRPRPTLSDRKSQDALQQRHCDLSTLYHVLETCRPDGAAGRQRIRGRPFLAGAPPPPPPQASAGNRTHRAVWPSGARVTARLLRNLPFRLCRCCSRQVFRVHETDAAERMVQIIAGLHLQATEQQRALVEVVPSRRQAIETLSDPGAAAGDVPTALMAVAVTAARGGHATACMVRAGCIEALAERLRMGAANQAEPKDERRCTPRCPSWCGRAPCLGRTWHPSSVRQTLPIKHSPSST